MSILSRVADKLFGRWRKRKDEIPAAKDVPATERLTPPARTTKRQRRISRGMIQLPSGAWVSRYEYRLMLKRGYCGGVA
jgi:hypothetical protein